MNHHLTFPAMLRDRASLHAHRPAIVFVDEAGNETRWTYGELWRRCVAVASALGRADSASRCGEASGRGEGSRDSRPTPSIADTKSSRRALLLFPPGIDFLPALVGAQIAGWIPVPTCYPKPHREMPRLNAAAADCSPSMILTDSRTLATLDREKLATAAGLPCLAVDTCVAVDQDGLNPQSPGRSRPENDHPAEGQAVAFLQYTSGSTSAPKGVIVSQSNLMSNLETIRKGFGLDWETDDKNPATAVFWLPYFHDMGLIGGALAPLYIGMRTVLMSPQTFVRRPLRWLQAIQRFGASVSGAPNFAFELCADRVSPSQAQSLNLSSLKLMFCGAEPIRAATLRSFEARFKSSGFDANCYYPCYGLAESTLLATGGAGPGRPKVLTVDRQSLRRGRVHAASDTSTDKSTELVSCGSVVGDGRLAIVDPTSSTELGPDQVGEIWLRGASVSQGYWKSQPDSGAKFDATLTTKRSGIFSRFSGNRADTEAGFCRTGDLGFLHQGQLYVTGRTKELIIVRGRNYFPQDIEATIAAIEEHPIQRSAALSIDGPRGEALGIVAELSRHAPEALYPSICREIRRHVIEEHEIDPRQIVLMPLASIPVTTSGKLRRGECRRWFENGDEQSLYRWRRSGATEAPPLQLPPLPKSPQTEDQALVSDCVGDWIIQWLVTRGGIEPGQVDINRRFDDFGLDSLMAIELIGDLEDACDIELAPTVAWDHPTIAKMASLIAARYCAPPAASAQESRTFASKWTETVSSG
jgi:acyl-CoA synthetase (AMP-forming)/AMP-acid ligase II/acyl carrier protein